MTDSSIELTPAAAAHVSGYLGRHDHGALRLALRRMGCSGWAFEVTGIDHPAADDRTVESQGVKVAVAAEQWPLLQGTTIDFVAKGINRQFEFRNPRVTDECGCGESVRFESDPAIG